MNCVYGRAGVRYVITKFSRVDSLPNFLTPGAPLRARGSSAMSMGLCPTRASRAWEPRYETCFTGKVKTYSRERTIKEYVHGLFTTEVENCWYAFVFC